ncbi:MAG: AraC family transcriptional regulator [Spirochaetales bacterium]|nr:AraC family transcriptional regulator [Spirochaetales bacterium]
MPLQDRHVDRIIPIEYKGNEKIAEEFIEDRLRLIIIEGGEASLLINGITLAATAPSVLALCPQDRVKILSSHKFAARSFNFAPNFVNSSFTFEALKKNDFATMDDRHDRNVLRIFHRRRPQFNGLAPLPSSLFLNITEWLDIIGKETVVQSDNWWSCRIRRYLLQILYLTEDVYQELLMNNFEQKAPTGDPYVKTALEYIHTNYHRDISLDALCDITNLNRTSLNRRFKEVTGHTLIDYLIKHRMSVACDALANTGLKVKDIAESCGFSDDAYFSKIFSKRLGVTPAAYRTRAKEEQKPKAAT